VARIVNAVSQPTVSSQEMAVGSLLPWTPNAAREHHRGRGAALAGERDDPAPPNPRPEQLRRTALALGVGDHVDPVALDGQRASLAGVRHLDHEIPFHRRVGNPR
jgi:hypothetical protein